MFASATFLIFSNTFKASFSFFTTLKSINKFSFVLEVVFMVAYASVIAAGSGTVTTITSSAISKKFKIFPPIPAPVSIIRKSSSSKILA